MTARVSVIGLLMLASCMATSGDPDSAASSVRFAIEVPRDVASPVFVQLNTEAEPVAWVGVYRDGRRMSLERRCDVPDCGGDNAVCGAAMPYVRRIADDGRAGAIEYTWDGMTSEVDDVDACQRRVPAPPGAYTARFCYAGAATVSAGEDPDVAAGGRVTGDTCVDRAFTLGADSAVVLRLTRP